MLKKAYTVLASWSRYAVRRQQAASLFTYQSCIEPVCDIPLIPSIGVFGDQGKLLGVSQIDRYGAWRLAPTYDGTAVGFMPLSTSQ